MPWKPVYEIHFLVHTCANQVLITACVVTPEGWMEAFSMEPNATEQVRSSQQSPGLAGEEAPSDDRQKKISAETSTQTR